MILLGIAGGFLSVTGYLLVNTSQFYFDGVESPERYPCDSCALAYEHLVLKMEVFGIIGAAIGSFGTWFVISPHRELEDQTTNLREL